MAAGLLTLAVAGGPALAESQVAAPVTEVMLAAPGAAVPEPGSEAPRVSGCIPWKDR